MSTPSDRRFKKFGVLEWLLITYVLVGIVWAVGCLSFNGEARFAAFSIYGLYAVPTFYVVSLVGLGDVLFVDWPDAIYWTAALVITNGVAIYALAKIVALGWRRSRRSRLGDSAK